MIERLTVSNLKAFQHLDLALRPLTVLTGLNSAGKSTVIQSLLLADLACTDASVPLNGPSGLALGEASDVLHVGAPEPFIDLGIVRSGARWSARLAVPDDRSVVLRRTNVVGESDRPFVQTYLSAERLGPRDLLEISMLEEEKLDVGHRGEYTAHVLAQRGRDQVTEELRYPSESDEAITVNRQVELWLAGVVGPLQVQAVWLPSTNAAMLRFRNADLATEWIKPANVGFGVTFCLPIIVAALTAGPSGTLVVENPEAHIHPAGQSALGRFLARVAAAGVQVVIETHSDHIINGIRRSVAEDALPTSADAVIYYFDGGDTPRPITVGTTAGLSEWPEGFFDQAEKDLAALARVRKRS